MLTVPFRSADLLKSPLLLHQPASPRPAARTAAPPRDVDAQAAHDVSVALFARSAHACLQLRARLHLVRAVVVALGGERRLRLHRRALADLDGALALDALSRLQRARRRRAAGK